MSKLKRIERVLLFLTLLFLPTQLGKHFWPDFSFVYSLPIDYLSPTFYFWDLLVVLLISVWLFRKPHINRVALNLFLIFVLSQTTSLIGGNEIKVGQGLVRLEQYIISGLFGIYLASAVSSNLKRISLPLTVSVLGEAILSVMQFIKGGTVGLWILGERTFSLSTPAIAKFDFHGVQFLRPYATFPHPNVLAGFMIIVIVILSRTKDIILKLATILAGLTILLTFSRIAILAASFSALWLLNKKWRIWFLVLLVVLLPILYTRFSSAFNFDVLSVIRREEQSVIAFKLWLTHPFFGVGLNNFIPAASDQLLAGPNRFLQPVHNIFLLEIAETGIVGLVGFILLIGYPIKKILNSPASRGKQFSVLNLLPWGMLVFLGLFDHYFLTLPQGYRLLFLVWGIALSYLYKERS